MKRGKEEKGDGEVVGFEEEEVGRALDEGIEKGFLRFCDTGKLIFSSKNAEVRGGGVFFLICFLFHLSLFPSLPFSSLPFPSLLR